MNLSAPTQMVFIISVVLAILGLVGRYAGVDLFFSNFHIMLTAWIVLAAGSVMKGL